MKATYWLVILLVVGTVPAYAQTNSTATEVPEQNAKLISGHRVVADTDRDTYKNTDKVKITGKVNDYLNLKNLAFIMKAPDGDVLVANEIKVTNGGFVHEVLTGNSMWNQNGVYTMHFIYDGDITIYSVKFFSVVESSSNNDKVIRPIVERVYIEMETDKEHYDEGDIVTLSGEVLHYHSGTPVTFMVISPTNNIVYIDQVDVNRKKMFTTTFITDGSIKIPGEYKIDARYGEGFIGSTTFNFGSIIEPEPEPEPVPIQKPVYSIHGYVFDYFMTNGTLNGLTADTENSMLNLRIAPEGDGRLILSIPRPIADVESEFVVLVDSEQVEFNEMETTIDSRTIIIPYKAGNTEISIFASYVVPEFGSIVMLILMLSIIGVILVTKRGSRVYSSAW